MKIEALTPNAAVLKELGRRLQLVRKQQGLTQDELATQAGLGVATLRRIEDGSDGRLGSWVRLLRALGMSAAIDALLPETFRSPMREARERSGRRRGPKGDGGPEGDGGFVWGDGKR
jgi:transcriptional regulator with XRE-family HTH domain